MSFPKYKHHVCLVSEQTLPNYLGAIMPNAHPEKVHLIVTERMKRKAEILEAALHARGIAVENYPLVEPMPNAMMDVLNTLGKNFTMEEVAFNVTGGTKIMALAAVDWASIQDKHPFLFYVDTASKKILQIGGKMEQYDMQVNLKLKELLKAGAGEEISPQERPIFDQKRRGILDDMVKNSLQGKNAYNALEFFNKCAKEAENNLCAKMPLSPSKEFQRFLELAEQEGKLSRSAGKIVYPSEKARFWCNGGWFEEFVQARLHKLQSDKIIDDWGGNLKIIGNEKTSSQKFRPMRFPIEKNELDVAFTAANRLFIIECKTANLAKTGGFSIARYKLDSLKKSLGGTFSRGMIVSIHEATITTKKRCKELGIELVCGRDVLNLEEKLKSWIQNELH